MSLSRLFPLPALILLAACGGASPKPAESPAGPTPSAEASTASAPASRDPKIAALAKAALECKLEDDAFDTDCPAYKAWSDEEALFEEGKGDDTLFSMLADPDLKVRLLAVEKEIAGTYWEDKDHAKTLVSLVKAEKNDNVTRSLGIFAAAVDWQTLGLADALKDLAQHGSPPLRRTIAYHLNGHFMTPAVIEADQILVEDADHGVADTAVEALSRGDTPEPLCKLLAKLMAGSDYRHSTALWTGSTSTKCPGMREQVAAELGKRLMDPTKVTKESGWDYARAARHLCRADPPELKKKGVDLLKRLAAPAVPDAHTRSNALGYFVDCDPKGGAAFAGTLVGDKVIGKEAKATLDKLSQENKRSHERTQEKKPSKK